MQAKMNPETVVDLAAYRAATAASSLPARDAPTGGPLAGWRPRPRLSARQLAHRARMLAHLREAASPALS